MRNFLVRGTAFALSLHNINSIKQLEEKPHFVPLLARVSGRVVVVRELVCLVTSAICMRVRGYEDCLPHDSIFSSHHSEFVGTI